MACYGLRAQIVNLCHRPSYGVRPSACYGHRDDGGINRGWTRVLVLFTSPKKRGVSGTIRGRSPTIFGKTCMPLLHRNSTTAGSRYDMILHIGLHAEVLHNWCATSSAIALGHWWPYSVHSPDLTVIHQSVFTPAPALITLHHLAVDSSASTMV